MLQVISQWAWKLLACDKYKLCFVHDPTLHGYKLSEAPIKRKGKHDIKYMYVYKNLCDRERSSNGREATVREANLYVEKCQK